MTDTLPIDRRLTDPERDLLAYLTVQTIVEQTGWEWKAVCRGLGDCAERGEVVTHGDAHDVYVVILGRAIVHATREWLSFAALTATDDT